jgi:hypothetical protein
LLFNALKEVVLDRACDSNALHFTIGFVRK